LPQVSYYHSDDPQRPGAGVRSVEQVEVAGEPGGEAAAPAAPPARPRVCQVYEVSPIRNTMARGAASATGQEASVAPALTTAEMEPGATYYRECRFADDGTLDFIDPDYVYQPSAPLTPAGGPPSAVEIARDVYAEVPLVLPTVHTAPGVDATQLVGFPIWLWVDDSVWRDFEASASVSGVQVTVVAQPKETIWDMGDGNTVTCGQGTPWQPDGPEEQYTDCAHAYQFVSGDQPGGRYAASVTMVWSVAWYASTGESGTLPDATRTTEFSLEVAQRQAVITYGSR
jgi:hypothetical protein